MSECQQYNNYVFMVRKMSAATQLGTGVVPNYDTACSMDRLGEVKQTALLFPGGLAYATAPRIDPDDGGHGAANRLSADDGGRWCAMRPRRPQ